jgi:hypothetical protein
MCPTAGCVSIAVALSMCLPPSTRAGEHLVDAREIAVHLQAATAERAKNQLKLEQFVSARIPAALHAVDTQRLRAGVAALSDDELRDLARRADALQTDPAAGGLVKTLLILGVIVLLAVVLAAAIVESCKEQGAECLN